MDSVVQEYLRKIELGDSNAINDLANYYDDKNQIDLAIEYWLKAIELNNIDAMNNLALYYEKNNNFESATKYYEMAIELNNIDAMYYLAELYNKSLNNDEMSFKYYLMAIEVSKKQNGIYDIEYIPFYMKYFIYDKLKNNTEYKELCKQILKENQQIEQIKNKITLFTKLNNIHDCVVCFQENIVNIIYDCGHEVCVDCFIKTNSKCYYNCEKYEYLSDDDSDDSDDSDHTNY